MLLKVMAGDHVNLRVNSWYKTDGRNPGEAASPLNDLVAALAGGVAGTGSKFGEAALTSSGILSPGSLAFLNWQNDNDDETKPLAFVNWVPFDEQFRYVASNSGFEQVGANQEFKTHIRNDLPVDKSRYLYIMFKAIYIVLVALTFVCCYGTGRQINDAAAKHEYRKGILITIGDDSESYFWEISIDSSRSELVDRLPTDTNVVLLLFYNFQVGSDIAKVNAQMQPFITDMYRCGEWSDRNQLRYAFVEVEVINDEPSLNKWWRDRHNILSQLCVFDPAISKHRDLKFRSPAMKIKKVTKID
jgi:hypothetical protein